MLRTTRTCSGCRRTLPRTEEHFHRDGSHSSGFQRRCRACTRRHFDSLDAARTAARVPQPALPPKDEATDWIELYAEEIATATVHYAVAHDSELLHHIADYLAGPLPETDDDEVWDAATDAEWEEYPAAAVLRLLADHYDELSQQPATG